MMIMVSNGWQLVLYIFNDSSCASAALMSWKMQFWATILGILGATLLVAIGLSKLSTELREMNVQWMIMPQHAFSILVDMPRTFIDSS